MRPIVRWLSIGIYFVSAVSAAAEPGALCARQLLEKVFLEKWKKPISARVEESISIRKEWNTKTLCTRPAEWDNSKPPKQYRFLVRVVAPRVGTWENKIKPDLLGMLSSIGNQKQSRILNAALIDESQQPFLPGHEVGVILETDGSHVFAAYASDAMTDGLRTEWGFKGREDEFASALLETHGIKKPRDVLTHLPNTAKSPWNDIILYDDGRQAEKLAISGIVLFVRDSTPKHLPELQKIAADHGLPLIIIHK